MVSEWWRWCCRGEVEGFSLLRSNHASEAEHPWFISVATGIGDSSFKWTSIVPCKTHCPRHFHEQRPEHIFEVLILRDQNPSAGNSFKVNNNWVNNHLYSTIFFMFHVLMIYKRINNMGLTQFINQIHASSCH